MQKIVFSQDNMTDNMVGGKFSRQAEMM
ncbi:MAG: hypothetical protein ACJA1X_002172, partial [Bermanella sp.]